jgi:hypothetical protein
MQVWAATLYIALGKAMNGALPRARRIDSIVKEAPKAIG